MLVSFSHHKEALFPLNFRQKNLPFLLVAKNTPLMKPMSLILFSNDLNDVLTSLPVWQKAVVLCTEPTKVGKSCPVSPVMVPECGIMQSSTSSVFLMTKALSVLASGYLNVTRNTYCCMYALSSLMSSMGGGPVLTRPAESKHSTLFVELISSGGGGGGSGGMGR